MRTEKEVEQKRRKITNGKRKVARSSEIENQTRLNEVQYQRKYCVLRIGISENRRRIHDRVDRYQNKGLAGLWMVFYGWMRRYSSP